MIQTSCQSIANTLMFASMSINVLRNSVAPCRSTALSSYQNPKLVCYVPTYESDMPK